MKRHLNEIKLLTGLPKICSFYKQCKNIPQENKTAEIPKPPRTVASTLLFPSAAFPLRAGQEQKNIHVTVNIDLTG